MKKCLFLFVGVAVASCLHAATFKWTTVESVAPAKSEGTTSATYAYLIDANVLSQAALWAAVCNNGINLEAAVSGKSIAGAAMSDGVITATTGALTGYNPNDTLSAYMVVFDANVGDSTYGALYFSEQLDETVLETQDTKFAFSNDSSINASALNMDNFQAGSGSWVNVPEPTSGMLLLLGMAGLALKRKRA